MPDSYGPDWGIRSHSFDAIKKFFNGKDLTSESEAQTRFDVIDRMIKEVLGWQHGQIAVEERALGDRVRFVDYILRANDLTLIIEAKRIGASFPSPTQVKKLALGGSILGSGEVASAINQALDYAQKKVAQLTIITNGSCWCFFNTQEALQNPKSTKATVLFPFINDRDAEELFTSLNSKAIEEYGLPSAELEDSVSENRLLNIVKNSDIRIERNTIADYIEPALNKALHAEAISNDPALLEECYVETLPRTKFDSTLGIHLADLRSARIGTARRIKTGKDSGEIEKLIDVAEPGYSPPVTLLIAPVGVGKTTYLKHFELVYGKNLLEQNDTHWIYVDFEEMGREGVIRNFIYKKLNDYLLKPNKKIKTDYKTLIEPAYRDEIEGLRVGPFAPMAEDENEFKKLIQEHIKKDFESVEPYIDKVFTYLSKKDLCVLVLDNTDLHEDEALESAVLSEGLALAKRLCCQVIISIRDSTYIKHAHDSMFDAFELKKLWLDPPPFKSVLSKRLSAASRVLEHKQVSIPFSTGGMRLEVPNITVFFDVVQHSLLSGPAGNFIESLSSLSIRRGLSLVRNFLTSGHIHADKALQARILNQRYIFPFHEVFKGCVLGSWKYFKEGRVDFINLFDSHLLAKNLRLLRLCLLAHLFKNAQSEKTVETDVEDCINIFSKIGASSEQIITVLNDLKKYGVIRSSDISEINSQSKIFITKVGGYLFIELSSRVPYVEACMYDTAIDDITVWHQLSELTLQIEIMSNQYTRMVKRTERAKIFLNYLKEIEDKNLDSLQPYEHLLHIDRINQSSQKEFESILRSIGGRVY